MQRADYQATLVVMFGLTAATLTGFLRQAAIAHQLGVGRAADIFLVAFAVPEFFFISLPIVLSPAFIPLFSGQLLRSGDASAWHFGLWSGAALLATLFVLSVLAGLGAHLYLPWLAPGFQAHERIQAVQATRLMLPAISLMGLGTLAGAALQVYRRFARPALATAVYNLAFIAVLFAAPLTWPVGRAAWGVILGAAAALLLQLPLLWRQSPRPTVPVVEDRQDRDAPANVGQLARLAGPLAAGYAVHHLIVFVDRAMATTLGVGRAAALYYAYHLALIVGQVSGLAVSTVLFPRLAEQAARKDEAGLRTGLASALRFVWAIGLPATLGLILLRTPIVRVLFERGLFDPQATAAVSGPMVWYALAVLADALCQPLWRVVYARRSAWTVVGVNGVQTSVRLLANLALVPVLGYNGLAFSALIGLCVQVIALLWLTQRWLGRYLPPVWWRRAARVTLAAVVGATVAALPGALLSTLPALTQLSASCVLGGVTYLAVLKGWDAAYGRQRTL